MSDATTDRSTSGFTDEMIPGADWTDREMFTAISELMEPATTVTRHHKTIGRGWVLRASCSLDGCTFVTNPRATADDVAADMIRHDFYFPTRAEAVAELSWHRLTHGCPHHPSQTTTRSESMERIDQDQWQEYCDRVISEVTEKLNELKPVAEAMGADVAHFQATFTLEAGFDQHIARCHPSHVELFTHDGEDPDA